MDVSAIDEAITSKTKAIILNSPCNPTGAVASTETLSQLAELARERDLVVLADEVYKHILFDGRTYTGFATLPGMKERTFLSRVLVAAGKALIDNMSLLFTLGVAVGMADERIILQFIKLRLGHVLKSAVGEAAHLSKIGLLKPIVDGQGDGE